MLKPLGLFHTPENWEELMQWIYAHNKSDVVHLTTAAAMAWNLAAKETNNED